ncbi:MAG: hypothetical protein ACI837_002999, partial [Crocinitomicaceae bacterium]
FRGRLFILPHVEGGSQLILFDIKDVN